MKTARFSIWLPGLLLLALVAAPARGETRLRWKFEKGKKYAYTTSKTLKQSVEFGGRNIDSRMTQVMDVTWDVKSVGSDGAARMTQTIDRIKLKMESPPPVGDIEYDTKGGKEPEGVLAQIVPVFKALVGARVEMTMNALGEVSDVKLPKEMLDALKGAGPLGSMLAGGLGTEEGLKAQMSKVSLTLPEDDLTKGKTWTSKIETPTPAGTTVEENTFTYEGPAEVGGAKVEKVGVKVKVDISPTDDAPVKTKIESQESDGTMLFDNAAGALKRFEMTQKLTSKLTIMGQEVSQTSDSTFTTEPTKPDSGSSKKDDSSDK